MAIRLGTRTTPRHLMTVHTADGRTLPFDPGQPGRVVRCHRNETWATVMFRSRRTPVWADVPYSVLENPAQFCVEEGPDNLVLLRLARLQFLSAGHEDVPDHTLDRHALVLQMNDAITDILYLRGSERVARRLATIACVRQWIARAHPHLTPVIEGQGFLLIDQFIEPRKPA